MRAQFLVSIVMAAPAHQVEIKLGKQIRERVRIVCFPDVAVFVPKAKAITGSGGRGLAWRGKCGFEKSRAAIAPHENRFRLAVQYDLRFDGARLKRTDGPEAPLRRIHRRRPQQAERIRVTPAHHGSKATAE